MDVSTEPAGRVTFDRKVQGAFRFGPGLLAGARPFRKALSAFFGLHRIEKRSGRLASGHRRLALFEKVLHRGFCDFAHGVTREGVEHS